MADANKFEGVNDTSSLVDLSYNELLLSFEKCGRALEAIRKELMRRMTNVDGASGVENRHDLKAKSEAPRLKAGPKAPRLKARPGAPRLKAKPGASYLQEELTTSNIPGWLKDYREVWKKKMKFFKCDKKKTIEKAARTIKLNAIERDDGSRLIKFKIGDKLYRVLDVDLASHTDERYAILGKGGITGRKKMEVELGGMRGNNIDMWKNGKLKTYIKREGYKEGLYLWDESYLKELLSKLGEKAGLSNKGEQTAMLMYLTGMEGWYRGNMVNGESPKLICGDENCVLCHDNNKNNYAGLCLFG